MAKALESMGPAAWLFNRGLAVAFARAFGVHRTTAWRDLQRILGFNRQFDFHGPDGKLLFSVTRACQGGPVVSVADPDGNEIHGAERRSILRRLSRYFG